MCYSKRRAVSTMPTEDKVRIHVTLSAELALQIDQLVGRRKRGAFIEKALEERLKRISRSEEPPFA